MYLFSLFFLLLPLKICCFNIDTNHFIVYEDPQRVANASYNYFGYTVLLHPGNKGLGKWIKIGAPKGNDPKINKFKNTGVVYDCPFMQKCKALDIKRGYFNSMEKLKGAWIGGSMDINYKFNKLAICGFRTIYERGSDYDPLGCCHISDLNNSFTEVIPLADHEKKFYKIRRQKVYNYGKGEAGFATHIPENVNNVILGAPGVFNWAGTLINIVDFDNEEPTASRLTVRDSINKRSLLPSFELVADATKQTISSAFELFGYSVTSGYYLNKKLYYAASAPKYYYKGKVVLVEFNGNNRLREKVKVVGSQFGEYFGAATASGDINQDGFDDLIVGAPYHKKNTFNEGAVYIFLGKSEDPFKEHHTLYGQKANGQFGSAIMFLGDLNNDGFGDLAIGAPYEEDFSGVLYIYKGNKEGVDRLPCQKIIGKDISSEIRGFGVSISRAADIDANGYKDLVVGAYLSGHAVLLRTSPIVVVHYEMKSIPEELKQDTEQFLINICYKYDTHFKEDNLTLNRTIIVDELLRRAVLKDPKEDTKTIIISRLQPSTCENVTVILRNITDHVAPITAFLTYKLANQQKKKEVIYVSEKYQYGTDTFDVRRPVLDEFRSTQSSSLDVLFSLGCGSDNFCESKLTIDAKFLDLRQENTFVVGSTDFLNLQTVIKNTGENAYFTQLEITLPPEIITFRQIPPGCYEPNTSVIICNVENPLKANKEKVQILNLDMKNINKNNLINRINISVRVTTTSNNSNPDQKILTLLLGREADITISGKSNDQSVPFGKMSYGMPNFTQIYQVEKIGVSPLEKVLVNITIPHSIRTSSGDVGFIKVFPPDGTFDGQPVTCMSSLEYIIESKLTETSEKLESDSMLLRSKRQVEVFKEMEEKKKENIILDGKEYDLVPNRTFFLNCSMDNIICSSILCSLGPFTKRQIPAVIKIKLMFNPSAVSHLIGEKDMILYTTEGTTTIQVPTQFIQNGNRTDFVQVSSLFINETRRNKKVALWIIILAVIAGILLLVLIIYGLTKAGFFKRAKKEELENLKAATQQMIEAESDLQNVDPVINSSTEGLVDDDPTVESSAHDHTANASTEGSVDNQCEDVFN